MNLEDFRPYLCAMARMNLDRRIASKVDASDIVQQTMLQAHQALDDFRGTTEPEMAAWLRQILARNLSHASRDLRRDKRDISRERSLEASLQASSLCLQQFLAADDQPPSQIVQKKEAVLEVAKALESLSDHQRSAILQKYWEKKTLAEIGTELEKSPEAVAGLIHRGLKKLREILNVSSSTDPT